MIPAFITHETAAWGVIARNEANINLLISFSNGKPTVVTAQLSTSETVELCKPFLMEPRQEAKLLSALESADFDTALQLIPTDIPSLVRLGPNRLTPLHYACQHGRLDIIRPLVIKYPHDVKSLVEGTCSPLHIATKHDQLESAKFLVENKLFSKAAVNACGTNTPLHIAAEEGHINMVALLTAQNISCNNPSITDSNGNTPLHTAAKHGHLSVVDFLVKNADFDPTIRNHRNGRIPLHLAAEQGQLDIVKYFIEKQLCDPSCPDEEGKTPLHLAAGSGKLLVVEYLIAEKKCDPMWRTKNGKTPLHFSSQNGHLEVVKYLTEDTRCGPMILESDSQYQWYPLHLAASNGHVEIVRFFVEEKQCDPMCRTKSGKTPLHLSSQNGHLKVVKYLTEAGKCDSMCYDENNVYPLHCAALDGHTEIVRYFVAEKQCDPMCRTKDGKTPLHLSSENGHLEVVKYLTENDRCDPMILQSDSQYQWYPLHFAASEGHINVVRFFIEEKQCDPMCRGKDGKTPLHLSSQNVHLKVVKYLTEAGKCDSMCYDENNVYPLHCAAFNGHTEIVRYFVKEKQCDPMCRTKDGKTSLHLSSKNGHLEVVKYLTEDTRCDPMILESDSKYQWYPLHLAASEGHINVVRFFIEEKQCDPMCRTKSGKTPLHLSSQNGHLKVVKYLTEAGKCDSMCYDENNVYPLHCAAFNGHTEIVQYFVEEKQCDPMCRIKDGKTPLHLSSKNGHLEVVKYLTEDTRCDPMILQSDSQYQWYPIHFAASNGHIKIVRFFFEEKLCDLTCRTKSGETPLHLCSENGHLEVVKYLTEGNRCDPMILENDSQYQWYPIHFAASNGHIKIVRFFFEEKLCDLTCRTKSGETPLHLCSENGHLEVVKYLTEDNRCDPMILQSDSQYRWYPLHSAASNGHIKIVRFFIEEKQCDPMCRTKNGKTPLHLSSQNGHLEVVKYLTEDTRCDPMILQSDSQYQWYPIHFAAFNGHIKIVRFFFEEKLCDLTCRTKSGETPLHLCSENGHLEVVKYLTEDNRYDPMILQSDSQYRWYPLHSAASNGHIKIVRFFIEEKQCDPMCRTKNGKTPLHLSSQNGHLEVVKYLTEDNRCEPMILQSDSQYRWYPLHSAAFNGHIKIVRFFFEEKLCDLTCRTKSGETPLHLCSENGHLEVVKYLTEDNRCEPMILQSDSQYRWYPLHSAAFNGHIKIVRFFIEEKQCDPMCRTKNGKTPLHLSSQNGHLEVVKYLTEDTRCDPMILQSDSQYQWYPIHFAAFNGHIKIVRFFFEEKLCDLTCRTKSGETPLHLCSENGHLEVVKYLTEGNRCDPMILENDSQYQWYPIHFAASNGHIKIVRFFFEEKLCDLTCRTKSGETPLHLCSENGHLEVVKYLTEDNRCDPMILQSDSQYRWYPLHSAASNGHIKIVRFFIEEKQCDPMCRTKNGKTPLHLSSQNGHLEVVKYLTEDNRCDPMILQSDGQYQCYPLHLAASEGHIKIVRFFIEEKQCDPMCNGTNGTTLLHISSANGRFEIVKYLTENSKCHPMCLNANNWCPLHYAAFNGHVKIVKFLVEEMQCYPMCRTKNGTVPLHLCSQNGHLQVVKYLTKNKKCDPMICQCDSHYQWYPVHFAASNGHIEIVKFLIEEKDCDPVCVTKNCLTPLHLASQYGHLEVVEYLVHHGNFPLHVQYSTYRVDPDVVAEFLSMHRRSARITPLQLAYMNGNFDIVHCLLMISHTEWNVMYQDISCLHMAAVCGQLDIVEILLNSLERSRDTELKHWAGITTLNLAAFMGQQNVVTRLLTFLEYQCIPINIARNPLHVALMGLAFRNIVSTQEFSDMLKVFLKLLSFAGVSDIHSEQLTKYYCKGSNIEIVKLFLEIPQIATVNSEDIVRGMTLHAACFLGQIEAVKLIIQADCIHPMITDNEGLSPFHYTILGRIFHEVSARNDYDAYIQLQNIKDFLHEIKNVDVGDLMKVCFSLLLRHICSQDYFEICQLLVAQCHCDPLENRDKDGETPLHYAAWFNDAEMFKLLVSASTQDPLCPNDYGSTTLHIASRNGNLAIVKFLVDDCRVQPMCQGKDGTTPLHWASETGQLDIIEFLACRAPFNLFTNEQLIKDIKGRSPLHYAVASEQLTVLQYLIMKHNCDPLCKDQNGNTVLHYAALHGFFPIVKYLVTTVLQNTVITNNSGYTPLHLAAVNGHLKIIQLLINYAVSTSSQYPASVMTPNSETVLHAASRGGHVGVVMFLVGECQSDPMSRDANGNTPLHIAASMGYKEIVVYLAGGKDCDVNCITASGGTALHDACTKGHIDIVKFLVDDQHCNVLCANSTGATPLHLAVAHGHTDIVRFLCTKKDYSKFCSTSYWTPLHLACNIKLETLAMTMVQILSNHVCSDLLRDFKGVSPLHLACYNGHITIVKFLISAAEYDPLQPDERDRIALHYAVESQEADVIDYLLSCKPDSVFHSDLRGVTPIMCATSENIVAKLLLKGADPRDIRVELSNNLTYLNSENYVCLTGRNIINVVGNARSGKSTLVKALESDYKGFLKGLAKVTIATPAGVAGVACSVYDKSKYFGPVVFHDFAGEAENYCGHSLSPENCNSFTKSVFIISVNLTSPLDSIQKQVSYWLHWVSNLCIAMECHSRLSVIVVGSHRDKLKAQELKIKSLYFQKLNALQSCWPYITVIGFAILNCQQWRSTEMLKLKTLLQKVCMSEKPNITNTHSMLAAFINYKYGDSTPVQLSTILEHLTENDIPLPQSLEDLYKLCQDLDCSGHIALLTNKNATEQSWIIYNQCGVFQLANTFLRDAKEHSQYKFTGVVPFSELLAWFGDAYNPNFIQQYLVHVEICQPINDPQIICKLSPSEEYYFFPALLEPNPCQELWKPDLKYEQYFGWSIQTKVLHFLPTQFLHTLLLRFAARFGSTSPDNRSEVNFEVDEYCMMWKNGIRWIHVPSGTEAVAQICEQSTVATVMMRSIKGYEMEYYKHRAEVFKMATDIAEEFHLMEITKEYILHPQSVSQYQHLHPQPLQHLKRYNIQRIVDAVMALETDLIVEEKDEHRRTQVALPPEFERIEVLLHFEPFLGLRKEVIGEIFDTTLHRKWKNGNDLANMLKHSPKTTTDQTDKYALILQDLMEKGGTVGELFHRLQEYSIFQGRKFLVRCVWIACMCSQFGMCGTDAIIFTFVG